MALVIPVEKLLKGIQSLTSTGPIWVRLRSEHTCYRDRDTGWIISGTEMKELPLNNKGVPSHSLFAAIRAGRFVRVYESDKVNSVSSKTDDLIDYILQGSDELEGLEKRP